MGTDLDVAVVGAGMAGLTAARELTRAGLDVRVFEAADRVGGRMACFRHDGYTVDAGAEQISTLGYRATWELVRALGVPDTDVPYLRSPIGMWRDGRVHPGVSGPLGPLAPAGLPVRGRLSLAGFLASVSRRAGEFDTDRPEDTPLGAATVAEVLRDRHPDVHDYLFGPVAGTFFGWDTARSAAAPMVSLMLEIGHAGQWRTYAGGMDTLARRMAATLPVDLGTTVHRVVPDGGGARLELATGPVTARSVLLCVPAPVAAGLHAAPPDAERPFLDACTFTSALKVSCLLDRPLAPPGRAPVYLLLVPEAEDGALSCVIVDHVKHPSRAPAGRGLLSLMATARTVPDLLDEPDEVITERLTRAAERYVPGLAGARVATFVHRFRHALPEATPAALHARAAFADRAPAPVDYAGDWITLRPSSEGAVRAGAVAASRTLRRLSEQVSTVREAAS